MPRTRPLALVAAAAGSVLLVTAGCSLAPSQPVTSASSSAPSPRPNSPSTPAPAVSEPVQVRPNVTDRATKVPVDTVVR